MHSLEHFKLFYKAYWKLIKTISNMNSALKHSSLEFYSTKDMIYIIRENMMHRHIVIGNESL